MIHREASTVVTWSPQQMYDLVVDMDRYPEFLPWCVKATKSEETGTSFRSEMTFAIKGMRETFRTIDRLIPGQRVDIQLESGPFQSLESTWLFTPVGSGTRVDFEIKFQFKNRLLNATLGPLFAKVTKDMVQAFQQRAQSVYGR
ncbi:MAG: type II toxin-antitoxin system RatA family toxin [Magnetococcales bacterium]|nr:type II toxin-antitoxin system RatA family toxin [Magnetococcales bacterium]MBF0156014.1 type II toxin-antitoxin system RatA family toxin [Magnetococcales bacterium]